MEEPNFYKRALFFIALIWAISIFFPNIPHRIMIPVKIANSYIPGKLLGFASNQISSKIFFFQVIYDNHYLMVTDQLRQNIIASKYFENEPITFVSPFTFEKDKRLEDFLWERDKALISSIKNTKFEYMQMPDLKMTCHVNLFIILEENGARQLLWLKVNDGNIEVIKRMPTDGFKIYYSYDIIGVLSNNRKTLYCFKTGGKNSSTTKIEDLRLESTKNFEREIICSRNLDLIYDGEKLFSLEYPELTKIIRSDLNKSIMTDDVAPTMIFKYDFLDNSYLYINDKLYNFDYEIDIDERIISSSNDSVVTTDNSICIVSGITMRNKGQTNTKKFPIKNFKVLYQSYNSYDGENQLFYYILGRRSIEDGIYPNWNLICVDNREFNEFSFVPVANLESDIKYFFFMTDGLLEKYERWKNNPIAFTNDGVYKFVFVEE